MQVLKGGDIVFDKNKFKYFVGLNGHTLKDLANQIGINQSTLNRKMNGDSDFTRSEIQNITYWLNLSEEEVIEIFFAK